MRAGVVIVGGVILAIALAGAVGAGFLRTIWEVCLSLPCEDDAGFWMGVWSNGLLSAAALVGLAGVGIIVAGILVEPRAAARVPVQGRERACPACGVSGAAEARYCAACGAAVAPTAPASARP